MRIFIFLCAFLMSSDVISQTLRDSILIKTEAYEVVYSEKFEQPLRITYKVACYSGEISRSGMDFYTNDSIKTSDDLDYKDNVYDKGHLAPAADFNCDSSLMKLSFSYLNCALQHQTLNRGVWKSLESREREIFMEEDVTVIIQVIFSDSSKVLPTGATVPDGFYKTILTKTKKEVYYFPNIAPKNREISYYLLVPDKNKGKVKRVGYIKNK